MSTTPTQGSEAAPVETQEVDLDTFSAEFFGQNKAEAEPTSSEDVEDTELDDDANEDTQNIEDDTLADEDDDTDEEEGEDNDPEDQEKPDPQPKKKSRFQERIDELTGKQREAERQAEDARQKASELEAKLTEVLQRLEQDTPSPTAKVETQDGPAPTDVNEDGSDKYPLGEFDPNYIKDLMKHTLDTEQKIREDKVKQEEAQRVQDAQRAELQQNWQEKLGPAQERYPDFQEKGQQLTATFQGLDPAYEEYLSATLMSMDYGPDVLYYLANNVDEAKKIVEGGPTKATIALGRLESKFADADAEKQQARPKVSKAPTPPPRNKGSSLAVAEVPDDTDDLEAFSRKLFKKK